MYSTVLYILYFSIYTQFLYMYPILPFLIHSLLCMYLTLFVYQSTYIPFFYVYSTPLYVLQSSIYISLLTLFVPYSVYVSGCVYSTSLCVCHSFVYNLLPTLYISHSVYTSFLHMYATHLYIPYSQLYMYFTLCVPCFVCILVYKKQMESSLISSYNPVIIES